MRWLAALIFAVVVGPWAWRAVPAALAAGCETTAARACVCCVIEAAPEPADSCCDAEPAPARVSVTSCPTCRCGPAPSSSRPGSHHQTAPDAPSRAPAPDAVCLIDLSPRPAVWACPWKAPTLDADTRRALLNVRTT